MGPKPIYLDVDSRIVENNLLITKDSNEEINQLLANEEHCPSKLIKPSPGFCVKTKEVGTNQKLFINICQTDSLPAPDDISESELAYISNSDEISNYRIPLSIGEVRIDSDNKGCAAKVVDIAINTRFFHKVEDSFLFKNFLLTVVFEGLRDKHDICTTNDRVILKNKRAYGILQLHRIQQREIDQIQSGKNEEILIDASNSCIKPIIEVLSENQNVIPKYRMFKKKDHDNVVYCEIRLDNASDSQDFVLEVGEDRIFFHSKKYHYYLDVYLPLNVNSENVISTFTTSSKILKLRLIKQNN